MSTSRRALALVGLTVAVLIGAIAPASAAFVNHGTSVVMAETVAATTSISATVDQHGLQFQPRVAVMTLTGCGWTAEGAKSPVLTC